MSVPPLTIAEMEARTQAFNDRYGIKAAWSDKRINRALRDHGLPSLDQMPGRGVGSKTGAAQSPYISAEEDSRRWRRENAMHMLAHIIAAHDAEAIAACRSCVEITAHIGAQAEAGG